MFCGSRRRHGDLLAARDVRVQTEEHEADVGERHEVRVGHLRVPHEVSARLRRRHVGVAEEHEVRCIRWRELDLAEEVAS